MLQFFFYFEVWHFKRSKASKQVRRFLVGTVDIQTQDAMAQLTKQ